MSAACLLLAWASLSTPARADDNFDAWANFVLAPKIWKGQTVAVPEPTPRPNAPGAELDASSLPVRVHVPARSSGRRRDDLRAALETSYLELAQRGWPLPAADADYGGNANFDLYLDAELCPNACAAVDAPTPLSPFFDFDAAQSFGLISGDLSSAQLPACVLSALAQAGLRAIDPSEAISWVRASGELMAWLASDQTGCDDSLVRAQRAPEHGFLNAAPDSGDAGALFLAMLSERYDRESGDFIRGLWETTRQRSRDLVAGDRLRSSPDLWESLRETLRAEHRNLDEELLEFAVARFFAGPRRRADQAAYRVFSALPSDAAVPLTRELDASDLPVQLRGYAELESLGSAYLLVNNNQPTRSQELQVWLRGELGPRWALTAVRLGADGRELGRTSTPARAIASSYLPIVLDASTQQLLLVITQLPHALPDADRHAPTPHAYELILSWRSGATRG
jgi:hypothetical protein